MSESRSRGVNAVLIGVLVLATVLRVAEFLEVRSLWADEAMLALGIGRRTFAGLAAPLPYDQSAALLFLWAVKVATLAGGMSEITLRLVPFLAAVATPWLVWRVAEPLVGTNAALVATTLTALCHPLIRYAAEVKPYGVDAFVAVAIIALMLRVRVDPARASSWWHFFGGAAAAMAGSFTAPFVVAGSWVALAIDSEVRNSTDGKARLSALAAGIAGTFAALLTWLYLPNTRNPYLKAYWSESFVSLHAPGLAERIHRLIRNVSSPLPAGPEWVPAVGVFGLLGIAVLLIARRRGWAAGAQIGVPILAVIVGAFVTTLPIAPRFFLFLAPVVFIACGALIIHVLEFARLSGTRAALAGTALVAMWSLPALVNARDLPTHWGARDAARLIVAAPDSAPVYIFPAGLPAWAYYSTDWERPDTARLDHFSTLGRAVGPAPLNGLLPQADSAEDAALVSRWARRVEVIGGRTPWRYIEPRGAVGDWNDSSWVTREVDRIAAVAVPGAWLYGSHMTPQVRTAIIDALKRRGFRVTMQLEQARSIAARLEVR